MSLTWADIREDWSSGWQSMQDAAVDAYGDAITAQPRAFEQTVTDAVVGMQKVAVGLAVIDTMMKAHPEIVTDTDRADVTALRRRYQDLGAGIFADATVVGAGPAAGVVIIVLGVVMGLAAVAFCVAAVAWAPTGIGYVQQLNALVDLKQQELQARIEASKDGRYLQSSTLPADAPPTPVIDLSQKGDGIGGGTIALGVAAVVGLVGLVAWRR